MSVAIDIHDSIELTNAIPTILWAEDSTKVYLRCMIQDALTPEKAIVTGKTLEVECKSKKDISYSFKFELFGEIEEEIAINITNHLLLTLNKTGPGSWRKLTEDQEYKKYIKVDWDRWQDSDDEDLAAGNDYSMGNMEEMMKMMGGGGGGMPNFGDDEADDSPEEDEEVDDFVEVNTPQEVTDIDNEEYEKLVEST